MISPDTWLTTGFSTDSWSLGFTGIVLNVLIIRYGGSGGTSPPSIPIANKSMAKISVFMVGNQKSNWMYLDQDYCVIAIFH